MPTPNEALRDALIRETATLLAAHAPSEISIRDLARRLGVSSGAPFHHFEDRPALFAAVAEDGWREVHRRLDAVPPGEPTATLRAMTWAYLRFALEHPGPYRGMFLPELKDPERFGALHALAFSTFWRFVAAAAAVHGRPPQDGGVVLRVLASWSTVHGFASLQASRTLEGKFDHIASDVMLEAIVDGALRAALAPG